MIRNDHVQFCRQPRLIEHIDIRVYYSTNTSSNFGSTAGDQRNGPSISTENELNGETNKKIKTQFLLIFVVLTVLNQH